MRFRDMFEEYFKGESFELLTAYDGVSGLSIAEEEKPDLIILDLILPKKDGFEVMKELKNNPNLKSIPIVVLTNLESPQDIGRAFSLGAKSYLIKANYSLKEIAKKINDLLG